MSSMRRYRTRSRSKLAGAWRATAIAMVVVALGVTASAAAANVNIVRQGEAPAKVPPGTTYFKTIQGAVNASTSGDYVLVEPGTYYESVKVTSAQSGIWIRGMNRNTVIVDGQNKPGNGIEIYKTNNVWVENLTVRNFDTGCENCGNEIWWNGGTGTAKVGAHGWFGAYLTAYDTGLNGSYGIFTGHETEGSWNNIYASGFNDSGMYLGACQECNATITGATMENNALGYSGSNSGGKLVIQQSLFRNNSAGIVPNSENPGDEPPPQDGECGRPNIENPEPTPIISTTNIQRCTIIRNNRITENNNLTVPVNGTTAQAGFGTGVILPGVYADLIESNVITRNANDGVFGIEFPNPFTPENGFLGTIFFQLAGNRISKNEFNRNGYHLRSPFAGDVTLASGASEIFLGVESQSKNNCLSSNSFSDGTFPKSIQSKWNCTNSTTPNPGGGLAAYEYIQAAAQEAAALRKPVGQPAPPPQPTMPNPCEGAPKNPLCK
ncbi:MAG TPA: hypothetical protein VNY35_08220 [Solirubrobacteraceae bacterium]|nr:hypothetical protein [Solirubrobacteraceae bacterium]